MDSVAAAHAAALGKRACEALKKNGFDARYVATGADALQFVETLVKPGMSVGLGGSMTLKEIGIHASLERLGAKVLDHQKSGITKEEKFESMRGELTCDLFLSSSNAITLDGEIFNVDGNGNRVAALTFGPKKTVVIAGFNKIVRDLAGAEDRVRMTASPMNCVRLDRPTPCTKTGICMDCSANERICRVYSVLKRRPSWSDFTVIIVGEDLGY